MDVAIGDLAERVEPVSPAFTCGEMFALLDSDPTLACVPVVNGRQTMGLVRREAFLLGYARPYQPELHARHSITRMMEKEPMVVEAALPIDAVAAILLEQPDGAFSKGFVVTQKGFYHGICTPIALLRSSVTIQMAHARELRKARERAEEESRSKTHFLASTSHELRTPLNAIIGFADMIHNGVLGPVSPARYGDYVEDILRSGRHLLGLINDILDAAKAQEGHMRLFETRFSLAASVWEVERVMRGLADEASLMLEIDVPATLPQLFADEQRIRQILINLLSNAIKFTPVGGTVSLSARVGEEGLVIAVHDTGIGMTKEDAARVIRPFEQVETWDRRTKPGTGLGLAIVNQLIRAHQGTLSIESEPGEGTCVRITLPPARLDGATAAKPVSMAACA